MRYPDGGGLTAHERTRREQIRLQAAEMFARGSSDPQIAQYLRVSLTSVNRWHQAWETGGEQALASKGPGGARCRLDDTQLRTLQAELEAGPAAHGWDEDQRWTLARIRDLIAARFGVVYTLGGLDYLLHRIGWSVQTPTRRSTHHNDKMISEWRKGR